MAVKTIWNTTAIQNLRLVYLSVIRHLPKNLARVNLLNASDIYRTIHTSHWSQSKASLRLQSLSSPHSFELSLAIHCHSLQFSWNASKNHLFVFSMQA
jgi:hypothetical protein